MVQISQEAPTCLKVMHALAVVEAKERQRLLLADGRVGVAKLVCSGRGGSHSLSRDADWSQGNAHTARRAYTPQSAGLTG